MIYIFVIKKYGSPYKPLNNEILTLTIVSVSLNNDILTEIDKLQKSLGFSGRSEIVRAGIRNLLAEEKDRQDLYGELFAVLLAIHDEKSDNVRQEIFFSLITDLHAYLLSEQAYSGQNRISVPSFILQSQSSNVLDSAV